MGDDAARRTPVKIGGASRMTSDLLLRDVVEDDLPAFFEQQSDPDASHMAAFTAKDKLSSIRVLETRGSPCCRN